LVPAYQGQYHVDLRHRDWTRMAFCQWFVHLVHLPDRHNVLHDISEVARHVRDLGIFLPFLWLLGAVLPARPGSQYEVKEAMRCHSQVNQMTR
jgi:hypothetical protein